MRFIWAVFLNFMCRIFSLGAFVASLQAIYIAFQFAISGGEDFRTKQIFDQLGLPLSWLPVVLSVIVLIVFAMPAALKIIETRQIAKITRENYHFVGEAGLSLEIDFFAITQIPAFLMSMVKFFSGTLFIICALFVVIMFRFDLFVLVFASSIAVSVGVVLGSWRNINNKDALKPLRNLYIIEAQQKHDPKTKCSLSDVAIVPSSARNAYYSRALLNWSQLNRSSFNQGILTGVAMSAIVFFVFHLKHLDSSFLLVLLYLVIAIRFAINTARETGAMLAKILEARIENASINQILRARRTEG